MIALLNMHSTLCENTIVHEKNQINLNTFLERFMTSCLLVKNIALFQSLHMCIMHALNNNFSAIDLNSRMWACPFCFQRNNFPPQYAGISQECLPAELYPTYSTIGTTPRFIAWA